MIEDSIVFVIDDDHSARIGLTGLLRTAGHHIGEFASVNEFLDALNPDISGCIVLDATMPGLCGEELLEELKARGVHLPIIVVSCDDDTETRCNAAKMKAVGFFRKPIDGSALIDAVKWAIRSDSTNRNDIETENN
jgi:FixJ family two-component response regulator